MMPAVVGNPFRQLRIELRKPAERFPENLELPLHRRAEHGIFGVIPESPSLREPGDEHGGLLHVEQELPGLKPHRAGFSTAGFPGGSRDF